MASKPNPSKSKTIQANPSGSTNRSAAEIVVLTLREAGAIKPVDEARVQIFLRLASLVDEFPEQPMLWREYRSAEKSIREETSADGDPFEKLLESLSAEVRDETRPKATKQG